MALEDTKLERGFLVGRLPVSIFLSSNKLICDDAENADLSPEWSVGKGTRPISVSHMILLCYREVNAEGPHRGWRVGEGRMGKRRGMGLH